jgi:hypothetical protein
MTRTKLILATLLATLILTPANASANSVGQCNVTPGNAITSTTEWTSVLTKERALSGAKSMVFKRAGFDSTDQTAGQWLKQRVVLANASKAFGGQDYMCRGKLKKYKKTHYAKGKKIFGVLPKSLDKTDFSLHKSKKFPIAKTITVIVIGLPDCGNPYWGRVTIVIYVPKGSESKPKPKEKCSTCTDSAADCEIGQTRDSNTMQCVKITQGTVCGDNVVINGNNNTVNAPVSCGGGSGCTTCNPPPTNSPPKCEEYKSPEHVFPTMGFVVEITCSDPEDGANVTVDKTVRRGTLTLLSHTGTTWRYQYIAPATVGDDTITFTAVDSKGLRAASVLKIDFLNPVNEK